MCAPAAGWLDEPQVQARLLWGLLEQQARVSWHAAVVDLQHPVAVVPVSLETLHDEEDSMGTACRIRYLQSLLSGAHA